MAEVIDVSCTAKLYAQLGSTAVSFTDAWLLPHRVVELQRAVNDVDEDRKRVMRYRLGHGDAACQLPAELPTSVSAVLCSPSGQRTARVVTVDTKLKPRTCLELWHRGSLLVRIDGSRLHGRVLADGTFGGFGWSPCEQHAVYVAEAEVPESPSLFAVAVSGTGAAEVVPPGRAHWFREDWGERLSGSDRLALFVVDFADGSVRRLNGVPKGVTPGQPTFWGEDVVYTGWPSGSPKLGAYICEQRPSALYSCGLSGGVHSKLTSAVAVARSPRPAPCGEPRSKGLLAFLGSSQGFETHTGCLELFVLDPAAGASPRRLVAVADVPGHDGFAGICSDTALPRQCWGGAAIFFNTYVGARETAWSIAVEGGVEPLRVEKPRGADPNASVSVLAVDKEALLLTWSTPCQPRKALIRCLAEGGEEVPFPAFGPCAVVAGVPAGADIAGGLRWRVQGVSPEGGGSRFDALLVEPVQMHRPGIILCIHGGPHMVSTTAFDHHVPFLVRATDCAVLLVNYRGSSGFGKHALESLPGHIGIQDVQDCMVALRAALDTAAFDQNRIAVVGGSHGGFLAAHLIGQHPDIFRVAAMRNPVTNLATMASATDIPDWCFVEGLGLGAYNFGGPNPMTAEALASLLARSPLTHVAKVKAPTLLALGMQDRRVPPSQGMEYYHALVAHGVPARLLCYREEGRGLVAGRSRGRSATRWTAPRATRITGSTSPAG